MALSSRGLLWLTACAALTGACGGSNGTNGSNGLPSLVRLDPVTSDATCPSGGTAVKTGLDANGNGMLDDGEVNQTQEICNTSAGASTVVRVVDEKPGMNCTWGGQAVQSGPDTNHNGKLDDDEVADTQYVCHQAPITSYLFSDVYLTSPADLEGLKDYVAVIGSVYVQQGFTGKLSWPGLTFIADELSFYYPDNSSDPPALDLELDLPALTRVGDLDVEQQQFTSFSLPALQAGYLYFYDNEKLTSIELPAFVGDGQSGIEVEENPLLGTVSLPKATLLSQAIYFGDNPEATTLALPLVTKVGLLQIYENDKLETLSLDALSSASAIAIDGNPALKSFTLPALTTMKTSVPAAFDVSGNGALTAISLPVLTDVITTASGLTVRENDKLASVSLPALARVRVPDGIGRQSPVGVAIENNPELTSVSLGALASAEYVNIDDNPKLPYCSAVDVVIKALGSNRLEDWDWTGNDESGECATSHFCTAPVAVGTATGKYSQCLKDLAWSDAGDACKALGGDLATFASLAEWEAWKAARETGASYLFGWIGYSDTATDGTWAPVSTGAFAPASTNTTFWNTGEPNGGTDANCAVLLDSGSVDDQVCGASQGFVCRVP